MAFTVANSRWIEGPLISPSMFGPSISNGTADIAVEFTDRRPNAKLKLVVTADTTREYIIKKGDLNTVRRDTNEKIPCQDVKEIKISLLQVNCFSKDRRILFVSVPLSDADEVTSSSQDVDRKTIIRLKLGRGTSSSREQVDEARRITDDQRVVLDGIQNVRGFFESLERICNTVKEIHPYIEGACSALLLIYNIFKRQEKCRDAARDLVEEMEDVLNYGFDSLSDFLMMNTRTRLAFKSIAKTIQDISVLIVEEDKGMSGSAIRDAFSTRYEMRLGTLRDKLRRAKGGLKDSIVFGTWMLVENADLKNSLKFVPTAHYRPGEGCLENTRMALLDYVDAWLRNMTETKKTIWVNGYAGSGKSALMNSIAERLEGAGIPFSCFSCKRDDADRSEVHRILPTIAYDLTKFYGDYRGFISNLVKEAAGRSIPTGDVRKQGELLFGVSPGFEIISPEESHRPPLHVIIIDALDECKDVRERSALLVLLRDFSRSVPWIKVIVASRREPDIVSVLQGRPGRALDDDVLCIDINDNTRWGADADIRLFIQSKNEELGLDLSDDQLECLQKKASGLFVWCTTVFRFIEESKESRTRIIKNILEAPPSSSGLNGDESPYIPLYLLYQHVLDSAVSKARDKRLMESILSIIFVASSRQPLPSIAVADILFPEAEEGDELEERREWVGNIISCLFAILYIDKDSGVVYTCHPSVLDFIEGKLASKNFEEGGSVEPFSNDHAEVHALLFEGCFTLFDRKLRFNICGLEDSFHLNKDVLDLSLRINQHISEALQYGCLFWLSHLGESGSRLKEFGDRVVVSMNSAKMLYWIEVLSLLALIDHGVVLLQDCMDLFSDRPDILDIAEEWERFLLAYGDAFQSTPHLYLSALSWLPRRSRIRNIISNHFDLDQPVPIITNVAAAWDAERWTDHVGSEVSVVAYSPDGRFFAAGCEDGGIHFWEARSSKRTLVGEALLKAEGHVHALSFSGDGLLLASGHKDGIVRIWVLSASEDGDAERSPKVLEGHTSTVHFVAFSKDGNRLISCSADNTIKSWNIGTGTAASTSLNGLSLSGTSIAFGNSSPICITPSARYGPSVTSTAIFSDNKRMIAGSDDRSVRVWDIETGEIVRELANNCLVHSVACSRDGRFLAFNDHADVMLFDAETGIQIDTLPRGHPSDVRSICFSADSKFFAAGFFGQVICVWDIETRLLVCELRGHKDGVSSVTFSPDGRRILSGSSDGTVRVWDFEETALGKFPPQGRPSSISCALFSPDGSRIISGSDGGDICLWDAHTGAAVGVPLRAHKDTINAMAFCGEGQRLVSVSNDRSLRFWEVTAGTLVSEESILTRPRHSDAVRSVAASPDGLFVATGSDDKTVRLWDVSTFKLVHTFKGHEGGVLSVTFSVDGLWIVSGSRDYTVRIWDIQTRKMVGEPLKDHSDFVMAVAASPDGQWIVSGSFNRVCIWSTSTRTLTYILKDLSLLWITSIAFSPDSNHVILGSDINQISVWNIETGKAVGEPIVGHTGDVNSVVYSPNCHETVSSSRDGTIRVWDTRARTDLELYSDGRMGNGESIEEQRIRWNVACARMRIGDGWIQEGDKLLLWVPPQYRHDLNSGTKLVIGTHVRDVMRPQVDYFVLFRLCGKRWTDIHMRTSKKLP